MFFDINSRKVWNPCAYQSILKPECILTGTKDCSCAEGVPKQSVGMKRKQNGGKPVFCFSKNAPTKHKTTELDRELNYNSRRPEQSNNAIIARIEPVMRSRNTEETVRELNEKSKSAGITAEYKAAEINTNGKLSRELAGAVTQADFARERNRIIFGDAALRNSPAPKGEGKPLNIQATSKAEEPENFPTFHQSARQQAQSRFLTESTEEITDSNVSKYTQDGQIFPTDYNSGTESHVSVQYKHGTGTRHNAEITAGDSPAGNDADIICESPFYKESTHSLSVRTEAFHQLDSGTESGEKEMYSAVSANEHTPILTQEVMPKILALMWQTERQENHS